MNINFSTLDATVLVATATFAQSSDDYEHDGEAYVEDDDLIVVHPSRQPSVNTRNMSSQQLTAEEL